MTDAALGSGSGRAPRWWSTLGIAVGTAVIGWAWFLRYPHWVVNSDGSAYLSVGFNLYRGHGFVLPDGSAVSTLRGPLYPLLLITRWFDGPDIAGSMFMSRAVLVLAGVVVALTVWRQFRNVPAVVAGAVLASVHPWMRLAGGALFVPDGLAALLTVSAVGAALAAYNGRRDRRSWWLGSAVLLGILAALAKETGGLALVFVALIAWSATRPRRAWALGALLLGVAAVTMVALILTVGHIDIDVLDIPRAFTDSYSVEAYQLSKAWWVSLVAAGAITLISLRWIREPAVFAGLLLVVTGTTVSFYASGRSYGLRNGALLPYGLALLSAAFIAHAARVRVPRARVVAIVASGLLPVVLVACTIRGTDTVMERGFNQDGWATAATRSASRFLAAHTDGRPIACSLLFCSFMWFNQRGHVEMELFPQYGARFGPSDLSGLDFNERSGWLGRVPGHPPRGATPIAVVRSGQLFGAVFEQPLLADLQAQRSKYLVVTGNVAGNPTFDAGRLVPYLEANPAFRRVFATQPDQLPEFVIVYEIVGPLRPVDQPGLTVADAVIRELPHDPVVQVARHFSGPEYSAYISGVLAAPLPAGPLPSESVASDATAAHP